MTNTHINNLNAELEAAEVRVRELRTARATALIAACPHKVGDVFTSESGRELKARSVSAAAKGNEVWLTCHYKTSAGKWSQGTKVIALKVGG